MRKLTIGDVTITSIIERDGPWRAPGRDVPQGSGRAGPARRATAGGRANYDAASGKMVITYQTYVLRAAPHHPCRHLHRRGQGIPRPDGFPEAALAGWAEGRGTVLRGHRLCLLHIFTSTIRAEHRAARRALGADLPECEIRLPQARIRRLDATKAAEERPAAAAMSIASIAADRPRPRRCWWMTFPARRPHHHPADAGAFALPLLRAYPQRR